MATLQMLGFDDLDDAFNRIAKIPFEVTEEALKQMASVASSKIANVGESMGVRDPESNVHILDKVKPAKPKQTVGGGRCDITFSGSRTRHGTTTTNNEIAFINEYGKRGQPARPFIKTAMERYADEIAEPGEKIVADWIENEFMK